MALIEGWLPPSRENWELVVKIMTFFPIVTTVQWVTPWYPMGKTSIESKLNIPGKWGWLTMEAPGFITLLYVVYSLPKQLGLSELPWANWTMAGMFTCHYIYRAILSPLFLNPSMSPIHPLVWAMAFSFQVLNGLSIGGWLGGYGPTTVYDWAGRLYTIEVGMVIWGWGLMANMYHDDDLREIRRAAKRRQDRIAKEEGKDPGTIDKVYMLPKNGLFHYVLYAHYLCEWIEWAGFWLVGGKDCIVARNFVINEIASMLPRALSGRDWYIEKFGKDRVGNKKAVIPGLL